MQTIELCSANNAFRVEYQTLSSIKDALRLTVRWQVPCAAIDQKLSSVRFTLKSLQRHLARLMDLEEADGYLSEIVRDHNPNLDGRMQFLLEEHERFRNLLPRLIEQADTVPQTEIEAVERLCETVTQLLEQIEAHERAESELLQLAMLVDEGGEG